MVGAWKMMPSVPTVHAVVNSQRNNRSRTSAMYFQSSLICVDARHTGTHIGVRLGNVLGDTGWGKKRRSMRMGGGVVIK